MIDETDGRIVECRIGAQAKALKLLRCIIKNSAEFAGVESTIADELVLAVNEACMNIIQHAYQYQEHAEIHLIISRIDKGIEFIIRDDAPCVDPSKFDSRDLNDIRPGGLGLHFIHQIMDEVRYLKCLEHGNTLILRKHIID